MKVKIIGTARDPWAQAVLAHIPREAKTRTALLAGAGPKIFAALFWRLAGFKVLWLGEAGEFSAPAKALIRTTSRLAHAIIAPNQAIEAQYLKAGVSGKKLSLIYPPCEPQAPDIPNSETFTIACDGGSGIEHGLGMIMRAVRDARDILGSVRLVIGGTIIDRGRIEWLAQELGIRESVKLVPARGYGWIQSGDVFLFMRNNNAPVPLAITHALAYGKPIIANDALPHREFAVHNKNGILLKDANSDMLSQAFINLARKPEWLLELGRESARFARERFGPDIVKEKMRRLIP